MKHSGTFSKLAALGLALAAVFFINSAQAVTNAGTQQGQAKVTKITGNATYRSASQSGDLKVGQILTAGASISTGPAATVDLSLCVNGQSLTISSDSTVAIDQLDFTGTGDEAVINTRLNLTKGGLNGNVKKLAGNSKYEIKTANGVAGVRGTTYAILSNGVTHVFRGAVYMRFVVGGVASEPFLVLAGQTVYPPTTPGGVPTLGPRPSEMDLRTADREKIRDRGGVVPTVIYVSPTTGTSTPEPEPEHPGGCGPA